MEIVPPGEPPDNVYWPAEGLPENCPAYCRAGGDIVGRISVWHAQILGVFLIQRKGDKKPSDACVAIVTAERWYFDQYGCRCYPPPWDPTRGKAHAGGTMFLPPAACGNLQLLWKAARPHMIGADEPGTIEHVGSLEDIYERLMQEINE